MNDTAETIINMLKDRSMTIVEIKEASAMPYTEVLPSLIALMDRGKVYRDGARTERGRSETYTVPTYRARPR